MKDSHGRTIDYLRISLTDRCNFRCIYCMPEEGVQSLAHEDILRIEEIEEAVRVAAGMGIRSIRLTGGGPAPHRITGPPAAPAWGAGSLSCASAWWISCALSRIRPASRTCR